MWFSNRKQEAPERRVKAIKRGIAQLVELNNNPHPPALPLNGSLAVGVAYSTLGLRFTNYRVALHNAIQSPPSASSIHSSRETQIPNVILHSLSDAQQKERKKDTKRYYQQEEIGVKYLRNTHPMIISHIFCFLFFVFFCGCCHKTTIHAYPMIHR